MENEESNHQITPDQKTEKTNSLFQPIIAMSAAIGGGAFGWLCVIAMGFTAVGMVGRGTGIGMAASLFGMIFGALAGLSLYGIIRAFFK